MLIPESGKPADLKVSDIKTVADADAALLWLQSVLLDMERQVSDRGIEDREWLKKLRAAERMTTNLRHRILELRDAMVGRATLHEAIAIVAIEALPVAAVEVLQVAMAKRFPHLDGFDLLAMKGEAS